MATSELGSDEGPVEQQITPPARDLGDGFTVRRALPAPQRRTIGPFVFFDRMGPAGLDAGRGLDVRPHPHIGLATVTYLFEGSILHRDNLGTTQLIRPGAVNWMIAGRGIAHSERTPPEVRQQPSRLSGIQLWVGLPQRDEEMPPLFEHHAAEQLPVLEHAGARLRLILGTLGGARSPVQTLSPLFYADAQLARGATLELDAEHPERAIFVTEGALRVDGVPFDAGRLLVLRPGRRVRLQVPESASASAGVSAAASVAGSADGARLLLLGGAPLDGPRYLWWNFVASSRERLQRAGEAWRAGRFDAVPGDSEFIPLPDTPLPAPRPEV
jgi:hypothetical protein